MPKVTRALGLLSNLPSLFQSNWSQRGTVNVAVTLPSCPPELSSMGAAGSLRPLTSVPEPLAVGSLLKPWWLEKPRAEAA